MRLRTLFILTAAFAVLFAGWTAYMKPYRTQRRARDAIVALGGTVSLEQAGPAWLRKLLGDDYLVKVTDVGFFGKQITDNELRHLKDLTDLRVLIFFHDTQVSDAGLEHLKGLTNIRHLDLLKAQVGDGGLEHLKGLTELRKLTLGRTQVGDAGLEHLEELTNLESLDLSDTLVTDSGLNHLKRLTRLQVLGITNTQVGDAGLEHSRGWLTCKCCFSRVLESPAPAWNTSRE